MKILLIDDDRDFLEVAKFYLERSYEVLYADNGRHGLEIINNNADIYCLIVDYLMPCMNGLDVAKIVHQNPKLKNIPIVMLTSFDGNKELISYAKEIGINLFIKKDISNLLRIDMIISDAKNIKDLGLVLDRIQ